MSANWFAVQRSVSLAARRPRARLNPNDNTLMMRRFSAGAMLTAAALVAGCSNGKTGGSMQGDTTRSGATQAGATRSADAPTPAAATAEWRSLLDSGLTAWRGYKQQSPPPGWRVSDGVLMKDGVAADLVTRDEFGDFELAFDWKLAPGGNAGVFYRATEEYDHIYWSGTEYQLLDDARHPDGRSRLTSAGAAYGLYPAPAGVVKPADQWNSARIVARGGHVEHWLNGQKLLEYEAGGDDWLAKTAASKFKAYPAYGRARRGHIGIQGDHTGALAIRALRIRVTP